MPITQATSAPAQPSPISQLSEMTRRSPVAIEASAIRPHSDRANWAREDMNAGGYP